MELGPGRVALGRKTAVFRLHEKLVSWLPTSNPNVLTWDLYSAIVASTAGVDTRGCMSTAIASARARSRLKLPTPLSNPRGLLARLVFRLPLILYRLGLGWTLGHQFLVLTHVGRRSGHVHQTVLKVLHYDPHTHECIVASAWGHRTDWFRNIQCHSALAVQTANEWYVPRQRAVSSDEAFGVFNDWMRRQRWFARLMLGQIGQRIDVPEAQLRALVDSFPFVAFRPTPGDAPAQTGVTEPLGGDFR